MPALSPGEALIFKYKLRLADYTKPLAEINNAHEIHRCSSAGLGSIFASGAAAAENSGQGFF
jgi:hypothetical protein